MLCVQQPAASEENRANVLGTCGQRERGPGGKQCFLLAVVYARVRQGICGCFLLESPGTAVVYVRVRQGICEGFFCFVLFLLESPGTAVVYARVKTFL